jgi:hypothetical protein
MPVPFLNISGQTRLNFIYLMLKNYLGKIYFVPHISIRILTSCENIYFYSSRVQVIESYFRTKFWKQLTKNNLDHISKIQSMGLNLGMKDIYIISCC